MPAQEVPGVRFVFSRGNFSSSIDCGTTFGLLRTFLKPMLKSVPGHTFGSLQFPLLLPIKCGKPAFDLIGYDDIYHHASPAIRNGVGAVPHEARRACEILNSSA